MSLPIAIGAGLYFAIVYNPNLLIATLVSWSLYYTIVGTVSTFVMDEAGPAIGSLFLLIILAFVSITYKMYMSLPFNASYATMYFLVTKQIQELTQDLTNNKVSRVRPSSSSTS